MIVVEATGGLKRARAFVRGLAEVPLVERAEEPAIDEDDRRRQVLLEETLRQPIVHGTVHPGADPDDLTVDIYLDHPDRVVGRLFACVVLPEQSVVRMLEGVPILIEDFCHQVSTGAALTASALQAALEAWASRNFSHLPTPRFELSQWLEGTPDDMLELLLDETEAFATPRREGKLPEQWRPRVDMAVPPHEAA